MHPIDPSSGRLMDSVGIESSGFHSRRLTRQMADDADLILCFEKQQRKDIVTLAPAAVRYTFLLNDFANMCDYCAQHNMVTGTTIQERLESVIRRSSMIRPMIPLPKDIDDPRIRPILHRRQPDQRGDSQDPQKHAQTSRRVPLRRALADCCLAFRRTSFQLGCTAR